MVARAFARHLHVLFVPILCCILIAGLWPFGSPANEVTWIANESAILLSERATIVSVGPLSGGIAEWCAVEVWVRPIRSRDSGTLLGFYSSSGLVGLSLHQFNSNLRLDSQSGNWRPVRLQIAQIFEAGTLAFLTVVSGPQGTAVYLDGSLVRRAAEFRSSQPCSGSFVVGDSPVADNTWEGELRGLAIYRRELTPEQVMANYRSWTKNGRPFEIARGNPEALYLFDEHAGNRIRDHGTSGLNLSIPERYMIAKPTLLAAPGKSYEGTWSDAEDILVNIGGFIPFGFTLRALLSALGRIRRPALSSVFVGLAVSLTIEVLQSYLPTRNSDLSDVLTNALGTWLGVAIFGMWRSFDAWSVET